MENKSAWEKYKTKDLKELERVNELRQQVNALHVAGKPDVFKPGFPEELHNYIFTIRDRDDHIKTAVISVCFGDFSDLLLYHGARH